MTLNKQFIKYLYQNGLNLQEIYNSGASIKINIHEKGQLIRPRYNDLKF